MSVLDDIIEGVRTDLAARKDQVPLEQLKHQAGRISPPLDALAVLRVQDHEGMAVIAEVKRRSPSVGDLAEIADPAALAARYERGGAAVVSVLTEKRRFSGSLEDLDRVRKAVDVPILRKDFTVDSYQIWEARAHGADLVLLIVAALTDAQLREFIDLTHRLGMNALIETHTAPEVERAVAVGARLIGVNVRNLKTLEIDRSVFAELSARIPAGTLIVAESGVRDAHDVEHYGAHGAHAVLVGEALVRHDDPEGTIAEFIAVGGRARASLHS